ncbi:hypothetical protein QWJ41_04155 [Nocardioides sp. SOB44]|uniref:DNA-binding protein n=1 Tax=Nocardioides cremeus TaxID=3058044 RepID=A0ABT8TLQ4_9ACTN|nr:hypothetical protein [Nocardioides cremeus]MDO3394899.1 hypothetical protein [Nocardioides cremeus]
MNLMTLHQLADATGHSLDALRQRRSRGTLGINPVGLVGPTHVFDGDEAEAWIKANRKEAA